MNAAKTWNATKLQGLYRHVSGTYYARVIVAGNKTWRSLKTAVFEIAKVEHTKLKEEIEHKNELSREVGLKEHLTGADAIVLHESLLASQRGMKKSTRKYWAQIITFLKKTWPGLLSAEMRKVTVEECQSWAGRVAADLSPTRYNNSLSLLKSLFAIAISKGARRTNPAETIKRVRVRHKDLSSRLPDRVKFRAWVTAIRQGRGRFSAAAADFVEFLAYTGMRTGEAAWVRWRHCDFERSEILIEGDPKEGTKNSDHRRLPMIAAAKALLQRLAAERADSDPNSFVLKVNEAQKAMDRWAKEVKMERITHHDLRHLFATICIESGVDIPTVAKWLGHKDGGALAMKVYGHLRNEHSQAAATRVSFAV